MVKDLKVKITDTDLYEMIISGSTLVKTVLIKPVLHPVTVNIDKNRTTFGFVSPVPSQLAENKLCTRNVKRLIQKETGKTPIWNKTSQLFVLTCEVCLLKAILESEMISEILLSSSVKLLT